MNSKLRRTVAIIALALMVVFTVTFVCMLILDKFPVFRYLAIFSGAFGVLLWFVIFLDNRSRKNAEAEIQKEEGPKEAEPKYEN
ncbi:MAG: hypothetical protein FWE62_01960 [Firmicutes bacterium]|nr:hypothetical protein [Bacillota bacterium]